MVVKFTALIIIAVFAFFYVGAYFKEKTECDAKGGVLVRPVIGFVWLCAKEAK